MERADVYDRRELCKVVKVSDPEMWYNQKTVKVKLFICPEYKGTTDVRLFVETIDDFAMEYTRTCYTQADVEYTYALMEKNMFDKLPKKVSYGWFLEHGYFPY